MSTPSVKELAKGHEGTREISLAQAVNEALAEELRRDPTVFVVGEDVAEAGTPFKVLSGLVEEFGPERVIDSPISEAGITGLGLGAAMTGMRPVVDIMFGDFLTLVMDQVANQAAKIHYMSGGRLRAPLTVRTTLGATRRSAAQHSQSLHAWVAHVPGLKVVLPATPHDAKGLLKSAIRDDNPVVFFEDKMMFATKGPVPGDEYTLPLGAADVKREGEDVTIVATSSMVYVALEAAEVLAGEDVSAEVVDPRTLVPLDREALVASARKTGRALVVDEGYRSYGASAELAAVIAEGAFWDLDAPVARAAAMDVPIPFSPVLEDETVPTAERVVELARSLVGKR
jgi:pyruvate/2-oxoglutarate/acetoin dehydrogenase E1 component